MAKAKTKNPAAKKAAPKNPPAKPAAPEITDEEIQLRKHNFGF